MASSLNEPDVSALDVIAPDLSARTADLKYMMASNVNVSGFVSVKLSGPSNYRIWSAQMICLIESQMLRHIICAHCIFPEDKGVHMILQYDKLVKGWIFGSMNENVLNDFAHFEFARDLWRELESTFDIRPTINETEGSLGFRFGTDLLTEVSEIDSMTQERLYEAAVEGCWWKAKSILKVHKKAATEAITENGDTILHIAVQMGQNYFVEKLLEFLKDGKDIETQNYKGRTALHIASMVGNMSAAQLLVQKRKELLVIVDCNRQSPYDIAYRNMMMDLSAYLLKSVLSSDLSRYLDSNHQKNASNAICIAAYTKQYVIVYPIYHLIELLILVLRLSFSTLYFLLWKFLAVTVSPIKNIEKKKKAYKDAKKILTLVCNQMGTSSDGYRVPILLGVHQGAYEVVDEILFRSPTTINCKKNEGHNIIQLAIINRSEKVYNLIHHIIERMKSYREMKDDSMNNLAQLAGRLAPSFVLSRTTGAALQLQRELIWREEVEKLFLPMELLHKNNDNETAAMVFTREHQDLMKQGEAWMKTTAGSCSITAALIVTIVFAAAITVPGGSNQESGFPVFKKEIAFTILALSNAFSLFTSATALLLFLSILTASFSEKDFLVSLPRRLIFGLVVLFLSTTAMIVAFGAILFLVFCDQRPWMLAPICGCACLPISVIITIKLPLLVDLIQSTYFPIFGKRSYLESCKVNRKNTIFTE